MNLDWASDPVVRLEKVALPAVWIPLDAVLILQMGGCDQAQWPEIDDLLPIAQIFQTGGAHYLGPTGVVIDGDGLETCRKAARTLNDVHRHLTDFRHSPPRDDALQALHDLVTGQLRPQVEAALDVFRRDFLTMVLNRQVQQAHATTRSTDELARISKQLFFVAINASVEAARAGSAGAGFGQISQDMRELSQSIRANVEDMRNGADQ